MSKVFDELEALSNWVEAFALPALEANGDGAVGYAYLEAARQALKIKAASSETGHVAAVALNLAVSFQHYCNIRPFVGDAFWTQRHVLKFLQSVDSYVAQNRGQTNG